MRNHCTAAMRVKARSSSVNLGSLPVALLPPVPQLTLVYGAKDEQDNNAVALRAYLLRRLKPQARQGRGPAAEAHREQ